MSEVPLYVGSHTETCCHVASGKTLSTRRRGCNAGFTWRHISVNSPFHYSATAHAEWRVFCPSFRWPHCCLMETYFSLLTLPQQRYDPRDIKSVHKLKPACMRRVGRLPPHGVGAATLVSHGDIFQLTHLSNTVRRPMQNGVFSASPFAADTTVSWGHVSFNSPFHYSGMNRATWCMCCPSFR